MQCNSLKLTSPAQPSMQVALAMRERLSSQQGFLMAFVSPIDFSIVSYFSGQRVSAPQTEPTTEHTASA